MSFARKRVVFDSSTLVGAVIKPHSTPAIALEKAGYECDICASVETLQELATVLSRAKFDRWCPQEERIFFLEAYRALVQLCPLTHQVNASRDPNDDKFISLALSANAGIIVSSDPDLLTLSPYQEIQILNPRQFLQLFPGDSF